MGNEKPVLIVGDVLFTQFLSFIFIGSSKVIEVPFQGASVPLSSIVDKTIKISRGGEIIWQPKPKIRKSSANAVETFIQFYINKIPHKTSEIAFTNLINEFYVEWLDKYEVVDDD